MKQDTKSISTTSRLKAIEWINKNPTKKSSPLSEADTQKLIYELEVHRIELEMQNVELILAKEQAEIAAEKYITLYNASPSGYITLCKTGKILELNDNGLQMLGGNRSQRINCRLKNFISIDTCPVFYQFLSKVFKSNLIEMCEIIITPKDNSPIYVHLTGIANENKEQCLITMVDITEHKQAEILFHKNAELIIAKEKAELSEQITQKFSNKLSKLKEIAEENELKYRSLIENSSDNIFCVDENGVYQFTNKNFASTFGKTPDYFIGKSFWDIFPKDNADLRQTANKNAFKTGLNQSIEVSIPLPERTAYYLSKLNPIKDNTGKVILNLTFSTDITDRKIAEETLAISETYYRRLFETTKDGILMLDAKSGMIMDVNPYLVEMLGYSKEQFIEKAIWEIGFLKDIIANQDKFFELQEKEYVRYEDLPLETADGKTINVEFVSNVYTVSHHKVIQCNIRDITDRKLAEKIINQQNNDLQKLNNDKDRFITILAHDLKSPFSALLGFSELLLENILKYTIEEIEERITIMNKAAVNIYDLLENILLWTRSQSGKIPFEPQELSFIEIYQEVVTDMKLIADAKKIIINPLDITLMSIYADKDMLKTILRNLISNAIKFSNKNGQINISAVLNQKNVIITVADNGIGLEFKLASTLFDLSQLHTTKGTANEAGTGFGLLLCKEFVEKHDGKIWVESEIGNGSKFIFTIPIKQN